MSATVKQRHHYKGETYLGVYVGTDEQWDAHSSENKLTEGDAPTTPEPHNPNHRDLSPTEWSYFTHADVSGFKRLIVAVLEAMPAGPSRAELEAKAFSSQTYRLDETLKLVAQVSAMNLPDIDVPTADAIKGDWEATVARETIS